jgi:predicted transcriptional regulator
VITDDSIKTSIEYDDSYKCIELFSCFSNVDAYRIFDYAERGIKNSTYAIKELKLTPKRYYQRLKELIDLGLIEKNESGYQYTPLGKAVNNINANLIELYKNKEKIEFLGKFLNTKVLTEEEKASISKMLVEETQIGQLMNHVIDVDQNKVERIQSYEKLVKRVCEEIEKTTSSMLIATNYFDPDVVSSGFKAFRKGVKSRAIMPGNSLSNKVNKLRMIMSPMALMTVIEVLRQSQNPSELYRETEIPFSFVILDNNRCFFEFPKIIEEEFTIAFYVTDNTLGNKFVKLFEKMWSSANKDSFEILKYAKYM